MNISGFEQIVPYLEDPFVLIGLVFFLAMSVFEIVLRRKKLENKLIKSVVNYTFILSIIVLFVIVWMVNPKPKDIDFVENGIRNYKTQKYDDAIRDFGIAIQQGKDVGKCYYHIGMSYHHLGHNNKACENLDLARQNSYIFNQVDFCDF